MIIPDTGNVVKPSDAATGPLARISSLLIIGFPGYIYLYKHLYKRDTVRDTVTDTNRNAKMNASNHTFLAESRHGGHRCVVAGGRGARAGRAGKVFSLTGSTALR